jgi:type II secretory ATPase GspE/PulE/Tfp pilus assembly ATPase PilB-like protein
VALRLLPDGLQVRGRAQKKVTLEGIGFLPYQVALLQRMFKRTNGANYISGPTGSDKSTTLKYVLEHLIELYPHMVGYTVEDPPEYKIKGWDQVPMNDQEGVSKDSMSRKDLAALIIATLMRADPDIGMIGEIRDGATALAAYRFAETGHRLWSTVHANDVWEILSRLFDLLRESGMHDPEKVLCTTSNLSGLMAQRLVPGLCNGCKMPLVGNERRVDPVIMEDLRACLGDDYAAKSEHIRIRGNGCQRCIQDKDAHRPDSWRTDDSVGMMGREFTCEIVVPNQPLLDIVAKEGPTVAKRVWMKQGGKTLVDHAIHLMLLGRVSPEAIPSFVGDFDQAAHMQIAAYAAAHEALREAA